MLTKVAVEPTIKGAVLNRGQVVGHQVIAKFVALVDRGPQRAALQLPGKAHGVAQAGGKDAVAAAGDEVLGPVVVDGAAGQGQQLRAGRIDVRLARRLRKAQHDVGRGHIQAVVHQRHAKGGAQAIQQHRAQIGHAVARGVTQQGMRLALAPAAPARCMARPITQHLMPPPLSGLGGALVSATSTFPMGKTSNQHGWFGSRAKAATRVAGGGSVSAGPKPAAAGWVRVSAQAARTVSAVQKRSARARRAWTSAAGLWCLGMAQHGVGSLNDR